MIVAWAWFSCFYDYHDMTLSVFDYLDLFGLGNCVYKSNILTGERL